MGKPRSHLVSYETVLRLVGRTVTSSVESTAEKSIYSFACGCVATRAADSALCSVVACIGHGLDFAALSHSQGLAQDPST